MPSRSYADHFQMLQVQIESTLQKPSVITISSATVRDGKNFAADGLANSLQRAGYPTLSVFADRSFKNTQTQHQPHSLLELLGNGELPFISKGPGNAPDSLSLSKAELNGAASREVVADLFTRFRLQYTYVVVNVGQVTQDSLARLLAAEADGVIITVRERRRVLLADNELVSMLLRDSANLLGVISISGRAIRSSTNLSMRMGRQSSDSNNEGFISETLAQATKPQTV